MIGMNQDGDTLPHTQEMDRLEVVDLSLLFFPLENWRFR